MGTDFKVNAAHTAGRLWNRALLPAPGARPQAHVSPRGRKTCSGWFCRGPWAKVCEGCVFLGLLGALLKPPASDCAGVSRPIASLDSSKRRISVILLHAAVVAIDENIRATIAAT